MRRRLLGMGEALQRERSALASSSSWRWLRRIVAFASIPVLSMTGVLAAMRLRSSPESDCMTASSGPIGVAVMICQREYERTRMPATGVRLADLLRRSGNLDAARALAHDLLDTDARGDAMQVLGKVSDSLHRSEEAVRYLQDARQIHRARGEHVGVARDDQALARIYEVQEEYVNALQTLDECFSEAQAGGDTRIEGFCRLTAARALTYAGYFDAARQELDRTAPLLSSDDDLAQLWFERGNLEQELFRDPRRSPHGEQAVAAFERSLLFARRAQSTGGLLRIYMNLACSLAEVGRFDEADRRLEEAGALDRDRRKENERTQLAARIAYRRGNHALAFSLNERAYRRADNLDERIDICVMQAQIALARRDLLAAVEWATRGVESAEKVRARQTRAELRPWVLAARRATHELLFTALALAGKFDAAAMAFDQWQGRTLLDEMARPGGDLSSALSSTAARIEGLGRWLPMASKTELMEKGDAPVRLAMVDQVALVVANGELWRMTARHGKPRIEALGPMVKLRDLITQFTSTPTDPGVASAAGALLLPGEVVLVTDKPLYVVLDAQLAGLPFVALRHGGRPLIVSRPVLYTPRLPVDGACQAWTEPSSAVVLADAAGDLSEARGEASRVATLFGSSPRIGAAATSAALFEAQSGDLLHVSVHADMDSGGGILRLHDRPVSAPEISARKLGPALVVLSACSTARSPDPELAGALSTAFLSAGARRVVATLRPVRDDAAREVTSRFYDAGGASDPVHVLARVQAELAETGNKEWPNFSVFGTDTCPQF